MKRNVGRLFGIGDIKGMHVSTALREFDWNKVDNGYDWAPVIDAADLVVDIIRIGAELSFDKEIPVVWDGYAGAYRVAA